jgi:hypothetical protein
MWIMEFQLGGEKRSRQDSQKLAVPSKIKVDWLGPAEQ